MEIHQLAPDLSVSAQILPQQLAAIRAAGFLSIICNRPDGEGGDQPLFAEIERAAHALGMQAHYLPAESGKVTDAQGAAFAALLAQAPKPVLAYCRTGMRSTTMWALAQATQMTLPQIVAAAKQAGFDMKGVVRRIVNHGQTPVDVAEVAHAVVIIGGGAAGIATAASLLARQPGLDVAIIDPADIHYYQPGWTLVGAGVFDAVVERYRQLAKGARLQRNERTAYLDGNMGQGSYRVYIRNTGLDGVMIDVALWQKKLPAGQ